MEYDRTQKTVILEGPAEITPILRAIGDLSAHDRVFAPDELVEIPVADACVAIPRVYDRSQDSCTPEDEALALRDLADDLAVLVVRAGLSQPKVEG